MVAAPVSLWGQQRDLFLSFRGSCLRLSFFQAIQDINNLKRFIRQAEMSHYALFKCYLFLKNCGSGDVLLKMVKVEHADMPEAKSVISVLEEFMREPACRLNASSEHRGAYTWQH